MTEPEKPQAEQTESAPSQAEQAEQTPSQDAQAKPEQTQAEQAEQTPSQDTQAEPEQTQAEQAETHSSSEQSALPQEALPTSPGPGTTTIANSIVSRIAGIAAREVAGVHRLVGSSPFADMAQRVTGSNQTGEQGVQSDVGQREASIDMRIVTLYGANVPEVAQTVREKVMTRVSDMTGLSVKAVNIEVVDLHFPGVNGGSADDDPRQTKRLEEPSLDDEPQQPSAESSEPAKETPASS